MAAVLGTPYSPPSPLDFPYSDTTSSIYPDRPIRPLPKRRLRSRLSSEVADSILFPLESAAVEQQFPESLGGGKQTNGVLNSSHILKAVSTSTEKDTGGEIGRDSYRFKGNDAGSDDEEAVVIARRYHEPHQRLGPINTIASKNGYNYSRHDSSKHTKPPLPKSTGSSGDSIDGYDSFENTNNKKKRKVPMSGSLGNHQSSLSSEMAHMGISSTRDIDVLSGEADGGVGHYYGSGSSATPAVPSGNGISGAGRGRYGKAGQKFYSGRSPLGLSTNGSNAATSRQLLPRAARQVNGGGGAKECIPASISDQGIISAAIANAAAIPSTPVKGQENISLLEQQSSKQSSSNKEQFTFICESESAKSVAWPETYSPTPTTNYREEVTYGSRPRLSQDGSGFTTHGTQTSPDMGRSGGSPTQPPGMNQQTSQQSTQQPRRPRRPLEKQHAIAARERRIKQDYSNIHHPPKQEEIWMCEFCEYESIFGTPPIYLIQQYEIKDRRERRRLAEKRRLLEKAKTKGRKGKKGSKNASKHSGAATQPQQAAPKQRFDPQAAESSQLQAPVSCNEEYLLDDYDDDPIPMPTLHPQIPSRIPQPVGQSRNQSARPASGNGTIRRDSNIGGRIKV